MNKPTDAMTIRWSFGPFSKTRLVLPGVPSITAYIFLVVLPFTRKRVSFQIHIEVFDKET